MAIEKIRTRMFLTSNLTVTGALSVQGVSGSGAGTVSGTIALGSGAKIDATSGSLGLPYTGAAPTLAANGLVAAGSVAGVFKLFFKGGGTLYTLAFPTGTSGGTITITSA